MRYRSPPVSVLTGARITPSRFQVPPKVLQSQMVTGGPPERATRCRVGPERNAICCPSGDQKGKKGEEPGTGISVAVAAFKGRTKSRWTPPIPADAINAVLSPPGRAAGGLLGM